MLLQPMHTMRTWRIPQLLALGVGRARVGNQLVSSHIDQLGAACSVDGRGSCEPRDAGCDSNKQVREEGDDVAQAERVENEGED